MESDLLNLKAEVSRQRSDIKKFGIKSRESKPLPKFSKNNAGVSERALKDEVQHKEETKTLDDSKSILEKKAAIYEKLHGGTEVLEDSELNQKFLVNFQKKIIDDILHKKETREDPQEVCNNYPADTPEEEWIEYTDSLGRSRKCQRKDLPHMKEMDMNLSDKLGQGISPNFLTSKEAAFQAEAAYSETQQKKWDFEVQQNQNKDNIHYSDILYNEARTHGVGFMKFSKDEKERQEQQAFIRKMHEENKAAVDKKSQSESKKKRLMEIRLAKVRERKRLKLGLPIKENNYDSPSEESGDEPEIGPPIPSSNDQEEKDLTNPKEVKVREWDIGKLNTGIMTQEEWVEKNRIQRNSEFAPPSIYNDKNKIKAKTKIQQNNVNSNSYKQPVHFEDNESKTSKPHNWEFAPPTTFDYYGPCTSKNKHLYK